VSVLFVIVIKYGEVNGRWRDMKNADKILVNELGREEVP
jgi:hypothetical protein